MRKLKNFSLVRNTSKLFSKNQDYKSFSKQHKNAKLTFEILPETPNHLSVVKYKEVFIKSGIMTEESPDGNHHEEKTIQENSQEHMKKLMIFYTPLLCSDISNMFTRIHDYFGITTHNLCTEWNKFVMRNRESTCECTALVPWLYNSRALVPYISSSSYVTNQHPYITLNHEISKISFPFTNEKSDNLDLDQKIDTREDRVYENQSKFASSLSEILEETEQIALTGTNHPLNIFRNCRSCPAVFEIKPFPSKPNSRKNEPKILLLNCRNFEKFEKTFTKLLAKNKIRTVEPLFRNLANRDEVLSKLERAFVNHNLRKKSNDIIKRNVIVMHSNLIENIREQLDLGEDPAENFPKEKSILTRISSNISNENLNRTRKPSNIMIINDEIFKGPREEKVNRNPCNISKQGTKTMIYLNNSIFKELNVDEVNRILNRKYASNKNEETETIVRIPTRHSTEKLKTFRSNEDHQEEYEDIRLANLIAAVAEKKRLEYIQRSKVSWQVFKQLEETLEKAKILNFPTQEAKGTDCKPKREKELRESEPSNYSNSPDIRNRKKSVIRTEGTKFDEKDKMEPMEKKIDVHIILKPNRGKAKPENIHKSTMREKAPNYKVNDIEKRQTLSKIKDKQELKLKNKCKGDTRTFKNVEMQNVRKDASKLGKLKKLCEDVPSINKKYTKLEKKETTKTSIPRLVKPNVPYVKNNKKEKISNSSISKTKKYEKDSLKDLEQMTSKTWTKKNVQKKGKEEFINLRKGRNISFEQQQQWSLREDDSPLIEVLHNNMKKSPLSSSQSEFIADIIEKPKKKSRKSLNSLNKISRKKIDSRDLAEETETNLVVEELLASSITPKKQKNVKSHSEKVKSKIPILGTPTSIIKQIEKVVATELATRKIREKFNKQETIEVVKKEKCKDRRRARIIKTETAESEKELLNEKTEDITKERVEKHKSEKMKEVNDLKREIKVVSKNTDEDRRLEIDDILAMNSNSIQENLNPKISKTNELKNKNSHDQFPDDSNKVQKRNSFVDKINEDKYTDGNTSVKDKKKTAEFHSDILGDVIKQKQEMPSALNTVTERQQEKMHEGEVNSEGIVSLDKSSEARNISQKISRERLNFIDGNKLYQEYEYHVFEAPNRLEKKITSEECEKNSKSTKTEKIDTTFENCTKRNNKECDMGKVGSISEKSARGKSKYFPNDSKFKGYSENLDKPNEKMVPLVVDSEIIREKRLLYFENRNENSIGSEIEKRNEIFCPKPTSEISVEKVGQERNERVTKGEIDTFIRKPNNETFNESSKTKMKIQEKKSSFSQYDIQPNTEVVEKGIETESSCKDLAVIKNESELGETKKTRNEDRFNESNRRKMKIQEKKSSFSQYDIQPSTEVIEKGIETESNSKDVAVVVKNESELCETKKTTNQKFLKQSVSDNVIVIKSSRKESKETVESALSIANSFLKQVQTKINNLMENSNPTLKNQAMKKCKEIAVKLKRSQEKLVRNVPASIYKICQEAEKIKNKLSKTKIIAKTSREIINKFTNTNVRKTIDSSSQAKLKDIKKLSYKPKSRVNSVIERKVTNKIKLLGKSPVMKTKTQRKNMNQSEIKDEKLSLRKKMREDTSPSLSTSDIQNRSIGSLFADTVASALAKCGDVEKIMSKYSDSVEKIPISKNNKMSGTEAAEHLKPPNLDDKKVVLQEKDEFLMSDGVRKLVFHVTLEKNGDIVNGEEWKCSSKAVLLKKSNEDIEKETPTGKTTSKNQTTKFTEVDASVHENSKISCVIPEEFHNFHGIPDIPPEVVQMSDKCVNNSNTSIPSFTEEANSLEETKKDLTNLKIFLQKEREGNNEISPNDILNNEAMEIIENNESSCLRIDNIDTPQSFEDLHSELISDRASRTAEGSTSLPPHVTESVAPIQDEISDKECFEDAHAIKPFEAGCSKAIKSQENMLQQQNPISKENTDSSIASSNIDVQKFEEVSKETTHEDFMTPQTSSTDLTKSSILLNVKTMKDLRVSEILPHFRNADFESTENSKSEIELHSNDGQEHLTRKEEIERSCKLNNYPNSLVCRERKNIVKTVLEKCESLEQRVENVLNEGSKVENLKEMFIDLECMGNCILKTVSSTEEVSNEACAMPKLCTQRNNKRTFATDNSKKDYSRFREWKPDETKKYKKEKEDFEALDEIHDEALENEVFFGKEINEFKKEQFRRGKKKDQTTRSIYHEIVRMSELNDVETEKSRKIQYEEDKSNTSGKELEQKKTEKNKTYNKGRHHNPAELAQLNPKEAQTTKDNNKDVEVESSKAELFSQQIIEEDISEEKDLNCLHERTKENRKAYSEKHVEARAPTEKFIEEINANFHEIEEKEVIQGKNGRDQEKITIGDKQSDPSLNDSKKHNILKKYAMISQEPHSSIFKISNEIRFDLEKKRLCHFEKVTPKTTKSASKSSNSSKHGEKKEKPRMILHISPSKELYTPPVSKNSDVDLKKLLIENPKTLMKIASTVFSKNQYLNFLLDLKSTKELKDYWINKIRDGIASSKTLNDLTKMIDFVKIKSGQKIRDKGKVEENPEEHEMGKHKVRPPRRSSDFPSSKSDIDLRENKTSLELETHTQRPRTGQSSPNSKQKKMLESESKPERSDRRNISFQRKDPCDHPEYGPLPYTLVKYLESPLQKDNDIENAKEESSKLLKRGETLNERNNVNEVSDRVSANGRNFRNELKKSELEKEVKENMSYIKSEAEPINDEKIKNVVPSENENIAIKEISEDQNDNEGTLDEDFTEKIEQQTAIVLPGREPMKISLISDDVSGSTASSMKDKSEKNALENLSDVLSNCSGPVSSLCSKGATFRKRTARKPGAKRNHRGELMQRETPSSTNSSLCAENVKRSAQRTPGLQKNGLNLKKFDNPLKKFVRNRDEIHNSKMADQMSNMENIDISRNEEGKIRVIRTKSLSEVLREDPNLFKKFRQKTMVDVNKEQTEEATKRFEYRFHDFRRKEDKCMEMKAKRQEEHKKDLLAKFKCLIQARKVATERTRQNIRTNEIQQIQPKVFSKILEKINYFKELEEPSNAEKTPDTIPSEINDVSAKRGGILPKSPKGNCGNRRFLHTKRKQINEDELVTWVQEHPAGPAKKMTTGNVKNCEVEKQNVIHIPWSPTCEVDAKN